MILYFTTNPPHQWARIDNRGLHDSGVAESLAGLPKAERCVAVVPGELVVTRSEVFPLRNRKKLMSAIPYAIEDSVINAVEDLHFSILNIDATNRVSYAYVDRNLMTNWIEQAGNAGLNLVSIMPDYLLLPAMGGSSAVITTGDSGRLLVRMGETGTVISADILDRWANALEENTPVILDTKLSGKLAEKLPQEVASRASVVELGNSMVDWLRERKAEPSPCLLTGAYRPQDGLSSLRRYWPAAAMAALAAIISFGADIAEYSWLKRQNAELGQKIEAIYAETFPGSRIVPGRLRTQTGNHLKKIASLSGGDDFSYLLVTVSQLLRTQRAVIEEIDFRDGKLVTVLTLNDFSHMDRVRKTLEGSDAISVDLRQSGAKGNKVQARFEISRRLS
jgi:general secretion pathway protein L